MPKTPRGKRVADASTGSFQVVNKAPNGEAVPYFDKSRGVWVAPWRKPDGKVGRPTGKTRVLAAASRDRHMAKSAEEERFAALDEGFEADSTIADVTDWWLQNVARHRVRATTFATYRKQTPNRDTCRDAATARGGRRPVRCRSRALLRAGLAHQ